MSSSTRENPIIRRMINLPRNILVGCSRAINQGIDLVSSGRRRNHHNHHPHQNLQCLQQPPSNFPTQIPTTNNFPQDEEWAFHTTFAQQYGTMHPFFYACRFKDALKISEDEHKLMFMYIHSPEHPFTPSFCRETLCSEVVVQFLDANFVCWGGLASVGEGLQMASALKVLSYPFCAIVASAAGDNLTVLQQLEGPVSPAQLVEILQRTIEEQGLGFGRGKAKQDENRGADRRLREEQDVACIAALHIDEEKEKHKKSSSFSENELSKPQQAKEKPATTKAETSQKNAEITQILIRFPNGERKEHSFSSTDKILAIYQHIDSLDLLGVANYRLISNFPRKVYGVDQIGMTLKDAGLHPKASLFLELI